MALDDNGGTHRTPAHGLLADDEPAPVLLERAAGAGPFVLTCDHAGCAVPRSLGDLGLAAAERERHIGWDIGALGVARELSRLLDAPLVAQRYSRLVIDCNRPPEHAELIPERSESTVIPGNLGLSAAARAARRESVYAPYHAAIAALLDARRVAGRETIYVAVHSFTPVYAGTARPWQLGVLYGRDARYARAVLALLGADAALTLGDNTPYRIDEKDQGIPLHAERRGLAHVLLELRQDLIAAEQGQRAWAARLAEVLARARCAQP